MAYTERYVSSAAAGGGDGSIGSPWTWAEMLTNAAAGDRCNVKADGTYARTTAADVLTNAGTSANPIVIRGYSSTITDGYQGRDANQDLVTTNMPSITYTTGNFASTSKAYVFLENLNFSSTSNSFNDVLVYVQAYGRMVNCKVSTSGTGGGSVIGLYVYSAGSLAINCDSFVTNGTALTAIYVRDGMGAVGCKAKCTNGTAYRINNNLTIALVNCVGFASVDAVRNVNSTGAIHLFVNCTFQGCSSDGYEGSNAAVVGSPTFINCMITDNGAYAYNNAYSGTGNLSIYPYYTRTRDNTSGVLNGWGNCEDNAGITTDGGSQSSDYVDYANGNFRIVKDSPGAQAGIPQYVSCGAYQRRENVPAAADVESGVTYGGYSANDYTGSLSASGGGGLKLAGRGGLAG